MARLNLNPKSARRGSSRCRLDRLRNPSHIEIEWLEERALLSTLEIRATITADNHYALYLGQADRSELTLLGWNEPGLAGNPGSFNWSLPESWTFSAGEGDHVYVVAWDDGGPQMWSGQFMVSDGSAVYSDPTAWSYTVATGPNPTATGSLPPLATVMSDIAGATWGVPQASAPQGSAPWFGIPGLSSAAQLLWHDTLGSTSSSDDHYVIFRTNNPFVPITPNVPPNNLLLSLDAATIEENGTVTIEGIFTDPDDEDAHTVLIDWGTGEESITLDLAEGVTNFRISHLYQDDNASNQPGTPFDVYHIVVTVTDLEGASTSGGINVTVQDVAPVVTDLSSNGSGCGDTLVGETITVSGAFTDVGTLDTHSAVINWGDGSTTAGNLDGQSITGHHKYLAGGLYTITVTVTDDDGGVSNTAVTDAVVTGVGVNNGVLYVVGTRNPDLVTVNRQGNGWYKVHANFLSQSNFVTVNGATVQRIVAALCGGDNHLNIAGNIPIVKTATRAEANYAALDVFLDEWVGAKNSAAKGKSQLSSEHNSSPYSTDFESSLHAKDQPTAKLKDKPGGHKAGKSRR